MKKPAKSEKAYQGIKKLIISGGFSGDRHWSFRTLAQRFRMSVAPVTEAVRRLEQEGILTVKARQGIAVKRLSHREILEYIPSGRYRDSSGPDPGVTRGGRGNERAEPLR